MNSPSPLSRALAPLAGVIWALYLATSVILVAVWITGFGEGHANDPAFKRTFPGEELRSGMILLSRAIDPVWVALGAAVVYLRTAQQEGLDFARRAALITLLPSFLIAMASAGRYHLPLGPIFFPENLGWKIGLVPFGFPLLWFVIIVGSREAALRLLERSSHLKVSLLTGVLSLLTIAILDPIAWRYRAWWLWYPRPFEGPSHAPLQSYLTWAIVAFLAGFLMRSTRIGPSGAPRSWAPVIVWSLLNLSALATMVALRVR